MHNYWRVFYFIEVMLHEFQQGCLTRSPLARYSYHETFAWGEMKDTFC